ESGATARPRASPAMLSGSRGELIAPHRQESAGMTNKGFSHLGLSTLDLDKTRDFYENVLGFKAVRCDIIKVKEGGQIRHIFFKDPNGIQLEFCCFTRNLNANDARMQDRFEMSVKRLGLEDPDALRSAYGAQADLDLLVKTPGA